MTTHDILGQGILERLTKGTLSPCPKISWLVTGSRKMSLSFSGEGKGGGGYSPNSLPFKKGPERLLIFLLLKKRGRGCGDTRYNTKIAKILLFRI